MSGAAWVVLWAMVGAGSGPTPADEQVVAIRAPHGGFRAVQLGAGARSYWLFEPTRPSPRRAPVVVFLHGWLAVNPAIYGAWIEHLTRRGSIVIFPRYHKDALTSPADYIPNALAAIRDAIDVLQEAPGHVRPDPDRFALVGHSAGGNLAVQLATVASEAGLPRPRAVVAVLPGEVRPVPGPEPERFPFDCQLVVAAAENDLVVGDARARALFHGASAAVPEDRRLYVLYRSDRSGPGGVVADHFAPYAIQPKLDTGEGPLRGFQLDRARVDRLDIYGFWRLTDLALQAAFAGRSLAEATSRGTRVRDLGSWPDGRPIRRPVVASRLEDIPHVFPSQGARLISWNWAAELPLPFGFGRPAPGERALFDPLVPVRLVRPDAREP